MSSGRCSRMISGLDCWEFVAIMAVIIVILIVPVLSWIIYRRLKNRKSKTDHIPPLMYITAVSNTRDIDIPRLPSPGEPNFLPPSYEDICNGVANQNYLSSSTITLNVADELPDYNSVASQRGSMVLSTFYSDNQSHRISAVSIESDSEDDSESEHEVTVTPKPAGNTDYKPESSINQGFDQKDENATGVFVA